MIEVERQQEWNESERDISIPRKILERLDERIPDGTGTVNWSGFISEEFMSWWVILAIDTWKDLDLGAVYRRGDPNAVYKVQVNLAIRLSERGMIEEAITTANTISSDHHKSIALADIAKSLTELGKIEEAKELFTEAITTANNISFDWDKSEALARIAKSLAAVGMITQAITTANTISNDKDKSRALAELSEILATQDRSSLLHQQLVKSSYSALLYESLLPHYQQTLTDTSLLRASFLFSPFSYTLSQTSVFRFLNHHLRSGDNARLHAIIRQCPQLGMDMLLLEQTS